MNLEQLEAQLLEAARGDLDIPAEALARGEARLLATIGTGGGGTGGECSTSSSVDRGAPGGSSGTAASNGRTPAEATAGAGAAATASIGGGSVWSGVALATALVAATATAWLTSSEKRVGEAVTERPAATAAESAQRAPEATAAPSPGPFPQAAEPQRLPEASSRPVVAAEREEEPAPRPAPALDAPKPQRTPSAAQRTAPSHDPRAGDQPANDQRASESRASEHTTVPSLAQQLLLLQQARSAAERGDGQRALTLTRQLAKLESSTLREEVLATEVIALCAAEQIEQARAAYQRFVRRFPTSLYTRRLQGSCAAPSR